LNWSPEVLSHSFNIRIPIPRDDSRDCVWSFESKAESGRRVVVQDLDGELFDEERVEEGDYGCGGEGECVYVVTGGGTAVKPKPGRSGEIRGILWREGGSGCGTCGRTSGSRRGGGEQVSFGGRHGGRRLLRRRH